MCSQRRSENCQGKSIEVPILKPPTSWLWDELHDEARSFPLRTSAQSWLLANYLDQTSVISWNPNLHPLNSLIMLSQLVSTDVLQIYSLGFMALFMFVSMVSIWILRNRRGSNALKGLFLSSSQSDKFFSTIKARAKAWSFLFRGPKIIQEAYNRVCIRHTSL